MLSKITHAARLCRRVALFVFYWCKGHRWICAALAAYLLFGRYWWTGSWSISLVPLVLIVTGMFGVWMFGYAGKVKVAGGKMPGMYALLRACWFELERKSLARDRWDFACGKHLVREQSGRGKLRGPSLPLDDVSVAVEGDPVTATVKAGKAGVPVEKIVESAPFMAEAIGCREVVITRGAVNGQAEVTMYWRDSVGSYLPIRRLPLPNGHAEAAVGIRRNGQAATESWEAGPVLLVGATGSGKSIDIWNMLIDLGQRKVPHQVACSDPKGGMEMEALGRHVGERRGPTHVTHFVTDPTQTVQMVRDLVKEMRRRQEIAKGTARKITRPSEAMPLIVCILDELHDVLPALLKDAKPGAQPPFMTLLQQGRSVMVWVIAACQDSKATVLGDTRDKFTQKLLKRVSYSSSVNTVISDGLKRGANAHLLDKIKDRGVGFSEDEFGNIERYRAAMVTDEDINRYVEGLPPKGMSYASRSGQKAAKKDTYVYMARAFGPVDQLLYVGVSNHPRRRFEQHAAKERWWREHVDPAKMIIEGPFTRDEALAREKAAIRAGMPVWNRVHNWDNPIGAAARRFPTMHRRRPDPDTVVPLVELIDVEPTNAELEQDTEITAELEPITIVVDPVDVEAAELVTAERARTTLRVPSAGAAVVMVLMFCALMSAAVLRVVS